MARRLITGITGELGAAISLAGLNQAGATIASGGRTWTAPTFGEIRGVVVRVGTITGGGTITALALKLISTKHSTATTYAAAPAEAVLWDSGDITANPSATAASLEEYFAVPRPFSEGVRLVGQWSCTGSVTADLVVAILAENERGGRR